MKHTDEEMPGALDATPENIKRLQALVNRANYRAGRAEAALEAIAERTPDKEALEALLREILEQVKVPNGEVQRPILLSQGQFIFLTEAASKALGGGEG